MATPQQPELARSGQTDVNPDHAATALQGQPEPRPTGKTGPVPEDNQPGHHPAEEQDKPDLDAFAAKLGASPEPERSTSPAGAPARRGSARPVALAVAAGLMLLRRIRRRRRRRAQSAAESNG